MRGGGERKLRGHLAPAVGERIYEVHELPVPPLPRMAKRRQLAVFVRDLPCGESLHKPTIVGDKEILIAAGKVEPRDGFERDIRHQSAGVSLTTFGRFARAETLLRP